MNEALKSALNKIIVMDMTVVKRDNYGDSINEIERIYNVNIPLDYKGFLLEYGGSIIKDDIMYQPIREYPCNSKGRF